MTSHYERGLKLSCKKSTRIVTFHVKYDKYSVCGECFINNLERHIYLS